MGNIEIDNFCDCDNNDSKFETSFKTNQNSDKMLCPFINTVIYQNFNIENGKNKQNNQKTKLKELNFSKNKSKFDPNDCEMNFEYHTSKPILKDKNNSQNKVKSIFNLNQNINNDKNSLNEFEMKNNNNDYEANNNINKIFTNENDNENENINLNLEQNQNEIEEEKINKIIKKQNLKN